MRPEQEDAVKKDTGHEHLVDEVVEGRKTVPKRRRNPECLVIG